MKISSNELISVLHAEKPAADRVDKLQLYAGFIGDWDAQIITHAPDGASRRFRRNPFWLDPRRSGDTGRLDDTASG